MLPSPLMAGEVWDARGRQRAADASHTSDDRPVVGNKKTTNGFRDASITSDGRRGVGNKRTTKGCGDASLTSAWISFGIMPVKRMAGHVWQTASRRGAAERHLSTLPDSRSK
ncbi:hypothetical protein RJ55_06219 [Drechmeria coniospora]|nr:hypothetical protein RJ55_06219 [Drechmeria coniospora]